MKISTTTGDYFAKGFSAKEAVKYIADAGFDYADFTFSAFKDKEAWNRGHFEELKAYADSLNISFNQAHAPFPSSVGDEEKDAKIFESIVSAMEFASILGVKHIIVHPKQHLIYKGNEETLKKMNYDFYRSLIPYCEKYQIKVAIENMWQRDKLRNYIGKSTCADPAEHIEYIDMLDSPWFLACLDVGHTALTGDNVQDVIRILGHERLKTLHIHDVDYIHDNHTLPGIQKLDFSKILEALKDIDYDGDFTLEADCFLAGFEKEFIPTAARFMADRARFLANRFESL